MINEKAVNLLASVIKNKYKNVSLDSKYSDEYEFYYEFKSDEKVSENDFKELEKEILKLDKNCFVKLLRISGVYLNGNKKNEMIDRISGKAFNNLDEIREYNEFVEAAKLRDHRKIGQDLDLFCFSDLVGPGLPLYSPRGCVIKDELQKEIEKICRRYGFQKVSCPSLANIELFEISGHAKKFNDELFRVYSKKGHEFVLKPVQCPHHAQIFASRPRSYKDLPIRYMESDKQYRAELQGAVGNSLSRVYAISIEDGHSFCRIDQFKDEVINMINLIKDFYSRMGLWNDVWVSLSVRDYSHQEKYIGEPEDWALCEKVLEDICNELNLNAKKCEGEAALYGPKIDFMFKDSLGREMQIPTVQLDFASPKRFDLNYIDENGEKKHPVMVHRAVLGSYERFMVLLLEQFKGVLPIWLSPVQVNVIPVNNDYHLEYASKVKDLLEQNNLRVELDSREEKLSYKMRESQTKKIPYTLILGDKEKDTNTISYRVHGSNETTTIDTQGFIDKLINQIKEHK